MQQTVSDHLLCLMQIINNQMLHLVRAIAHDVDRIALCS